MKKDSCFCSGRSRKIMSAFMAVIVLILSYLAIVYGMLRTQLEDMLAQKLEYGLSYYYNLQNYREAEKCFKTALFLEKYIIFWDKQEKLPACYACLALVNEGMGEYEKSADMYEKSLSAYEKYLPQDHENIALMHTKASVIYSLLGNNRMILEHAGSANDYYQSLEKEQQNINAATAALGLAYACYNEEDYEKAAIYFETGIPIVYEAQDWNIDDDAGPKILAIAYKAAADTYGKLGNREMQLYYEGKYEDIVWLRQIDEEEITELMKAFHWEIH